MILLLLTRYHFGPFWVRMIPAILLYFIFINFCFNEASFFFNEAHCMKRMYLYEFNEPDSVRIARLEQEIELLKQRISNLESLLNSSEHSRYVDAMAHQTSISTYTENQTFLLQENSQLREQLSDSEQTMGDMGGTNLELRVALREEEDAHRISQSEFASDRKKSMEDYQKLEAKFKKKPRK